MFGKSIKRLFGGGDDNSGQPPRNARLLECFAYLDVVKPGSAARLVRYIETGEDGGILAELSNSTKGISEALHQHRVEVARKVHPSREIIHYAPHAASETAIFNAVLQSAGDPRRIVRVIVAGMAGQLMAKGKYFGYRANDSHMKAGPYNLFESVRRWRTDDVPESERSSFADLVKASTIMGINHESLLASCIWRNWRPDGLGIYRYDWITLATLDDFSRAMKQLDASQREDLLEACLGGQAQPQGDVLPLWFDLTDDGSAKVRDAARRLILASGDDRVTAMATDALSTGKAAQRATMVQILAEIGSDEAMAALEARRSEEKTRAVQLLIDQFLSAPAAQAADPDKPGYEAADGSWVTPPDVVELPDDGAKPFGTEDEAELRARAQKDYEERVERWKNRPENGPWYRDKKPELKDSWKHLLDIFNGNMNDETVSRWLYTDWMAKAVKRASAGRLLRIWAKDAGADLWLYSYGSSVDQWMEEQLEDGAFDIRTMIRAVEEHLAKWRHPARSVHFEKPLANESLADFTMRQMIAGRGHSTALPDRALWPLIADYLPLIAENLPPHELNTSKNLRAMRLIERLPKLPKMLVPSLVNASMAEARGVRTTAQSLLANAEAVTPQIVDALGDSRQAIRANAAAFLGQRGDDSVLPDLVRSLGKEKADLARAALISAISMLGGDTSKWLGKAALEKEAAANAKKLKGDKIDWLAMDTAPVLHWQDGTPVADDLLVGWLKLAVKLKTLEDGAGLFKLYLDQLRPQDASALGDWVLASWIAYDTAKRSREEVYRKQLESAKIYLAKYGRTGVYKDYTPERLAEQWTRAAISDYLNSGAASKGILALALKATPLTLARLASGYLKNHGKRVAQAKSVVELLALSGSAEALQVVVATATRFKQRTVRELAEVMVDRIAEERGWTADELADRSIPSGGLEEGGLLDLPMGEDAKPYQARLDSDLVLHLHNPDGKIVKSLPAGTDENSKESKAQLTSAKKILKEVVEKQKGRLYEAMLTGREWTLDAWQSDLRGHPIVGRLTERAIWRGLDADGNVRVTFRPTAEGDVMTASGDDADMSGIERIDLAHATSLSGDDLAAWTEHLSDFEVKPLFSQIDRPVLAIGDDQKEAHSIDDREGWMMDNLKLRGLASKLGYDQGETGDGGSTTTYDKRIDRLGYRASIEFSGTYFGDDSHPVALIRLQFFRAGSRAYRPVALADVPPRLLSECWNDLHDIAKAGAYDPDWKKKGLW
ncbi:MAG: DUF4132 domain-containing protein [Paracoccus denitrificans]|uniref:DUF4132 domain-containing protein n=1 Tax=Paracoccus denitrificans TaxID=266 RepID=A0A533IDG5_PARDE|nr:MAG: DUF4132 domain-containing protein [Paracoccus denitrificans]